LRHVPTLLPRLIFNSWAQGFSLVSTWDYWHVSLW
jgi:hypothetical protein